MVLEALGAKERNGNPRTTTSQVLFFNESRGKAADEVETKTERKRDNEREGGGGRRGKRKGEEEEKCREHKSGFREKGADKMISSR